MNMGNLQFEQGVLIERAQIAIFAKPTRNARVASNVGVEQCPTIHPS
jgi:hypothetical protein